MKLIDLHCDTLSMLMKEEHKGSSIISNNLDVDLEGLKKANMAVQVYACFVYGGPENCWDQGYQKVLSMLQRLEDEQTDELKQIFSYSDIEKNILENRISAMAAVEEGGVINGDMSRLSHLYDKGVRLITLTWNFENCIGYPNSWDEIEMKKGLKPFGIEVIKEMNHKGMIIDVSHLSEGGFWDCVNYSSAPICASHSDARALCDHPRNLTDEMLKALANNGGVAGLNFVPVFLNPDKLATCHDIALHAKHMIQVAGEDVVAFGADLDGFGNEKRPDWVGHVSQMELIWPHFKKVGITERQIDKICFENANRVLKNVLK